MIKEFLSRVFKPVRHEVELPPIKSTRFELEVEQGRRKIEHDRTNRLEKILVDYRRQDQVFRR